jgi:hypothetical protein
MIVVPNAAIRVEGRGIELDELDTNDVVFVVAVVVRRHL